MLRRHNKISQAGEAGGPPHQHQLLQFTLNGHVLSFAAEAVYVASGSHTYRVEFVGAAPLCFSFTFGYLAMESS